MTLQSRGAVYIWYDDVTNLRFEWIQSASHYVNVFVRVRSPEDQLAYVLIDSLDTTLVFRDALHPEPEEVVPTIERAIAENLLNLAEIGAVERQVVRRWPWRRTNR